MENQNQRIQLSKLTIEKKVLYLYMALKIQGVFIDKDLIEQIINTYDLILQKGGNINIYDCIKYKYTEENDMNKLNAMKILVSELSKKDKKEFLKWASNL